MRHICLDLIHIPVKFPEDIYITVTDLWRVQDFFYDFQRSITQKLRKGEQSFLSGTLCLDFIYISIKYHEDILKIVYGWTDRWTEPCHNASSFFRNGPIKSALRGMYNPG